MSPDPHLPPTGRQQSRPARTGLGNDGGGATLAERQLQRQRDELRTQKKKSDNEVRRLREENARLAAAADAARSASGSAAREDANGDEDPEGGDDDMDCAEAYASWTESERREQLEVSRGGLAYAIKRHGEHSEEADVVRAEIEALQRATRDAKPFRAHRSLLERRRDKLRRQQERDGEAIERVQSEIEEQQSKLQELQKAVADRTKALASVEDELTELVKRALAEEGGADDGATAWSADAATTTIRALAAKPGVPREVAALLEQVQLAMAALAAATAPVSGGHAQQHAHAQQQPPQQHQHQQKHQGAELGSTGGKDGTTCGGKGSATGAGNAGAAPAFLGPQGRWAKGPVAAGSAAGTTAAAERGGASGGSTDATGTCDETATATATETPAAPKAAAAAPVGTPAAPTPRVPAAEESEEELVDASADNDVQMDGDVETSINQLPKEVQAKLRRALKSRGGIRRGERATDGDEDEGRGRDRERSPRPAPRKGGTDDVGPGDA